MSTPYHNKHFRNLSEELKNKTHDYKLSTSSNEDLNISLTKLQADMILDSIFSSSNLKETSRDPTIASPI